MQHLKVFVKQDCPQCPAAKDVASKFPETEVYDIEQAEGLAEAAFYSILCTPSIIIVDDEGHEVRAWRCTVPSSKDIAACI